MVERSTVAEITTKLLSHDNTSTVLSHACDMGGFQVHNMFAGDPALW